MVLVVEHMYSEIPGILFRLLLRVVEAVGEVVVDRRLEELLLHPE
jgi:hypothetical protein